MPQGVYRYDIEAWGACLAGILGVPGRLRIQIRLRAFPRILPTFLTRPADVKPPPTQGDFPKPTGGAVGAPTEQGRGHPGGCGCRGRGAERNTAASPGLPDRRRLQGMSTQTAGGVPEHRTAESYHTRPAETSARQIGGSGLRGSGPLAQGRWAQGQRGTVWRDRGHRLGPPVASGPHAAGGWGSGRGAGRPRWADGAAQSKHRPRARRLARARAVRMRLDSRRSSAVGMGIHYSHAPPAWSRAAPCSL